MLTLGEKIDNCLRLLAAAAVGNVNDPKHLEPRVLSPEEREAMLRALRDVGWFPEPQEPASQESARYYMNWHGAGNFPYRGTNP